MRARSGRGAVVEDQRKKPFAAVSVDLIDRFGPLIGKGHGLAVYLVLVRYASNKTHAAMLWNRTVAKKLGVSKATVKRAIDLLIQYRLIKFESGQKDGQANRYILLDLPVLKQGGTTPLFDGQDEVGGSQVNHLEPPEERVNQPSITYTPESGGWFTGESPVDHGRSGGSSPAVQGQLTGEPGVAQIRDRIKGTSRLIQSTKVTTPQNQTQEPGTNLPTVEDQSSRSQSLFGQVREIASLHPKIYDVFNLSTADEEFKAIAAAIRRDGDFVLVGTKIMAQEVANWPRDELWYLADPVKFFSKSHYRKDPAEWKRPGKGKGDDFARQCEEADELLQRRQSRASGAG